MEVFETVEAFRRARAKLGELGLVPTMGYLHEGHLQLVRRARAECEAVAVSIFVNPTQFGPHEDFERYPRDLNRDLDLLAREGVDLVFAPSVEEMYPAPYSTYIIVEDVTDVLEGAARPGHFRGVATVVCKLLNIAQPTRAYFGQKDAQQTVVVRRMVRDLNIPTEIVVVPTQREPDGLAMSSRNVYLTPEQRAVAPTIYRALEAARAAYEQGERDAEELRRAMRRVLDAEPQLKTEYASVADPLTLQELERVGERGALVSIAARLGPVRLIDNMLL